MRLYPTSTVRSQPLDRNPQTLAQGYAGYAIAPHAATQRWTYTVPASTKFLLSGINATLWSEVAPGLNGDRGLYVNLTPSGAGAVTLCNSSLFNNASLDPMLTLWAPNLTLQPADLMAGFTYDLGTGGSWNYNLAYGGSRYDA